MIQINDVKDILPHKDLKKVSLTDDNIIPVFGEHTDYLAKKLYAHFNRIAGEDSPFFPEGCNTYSEHRDFIIKHVELQARLGAVAARVIGERGVLYDLGCGMAIPSDAYSLITGRHAVAIDDDEEAISDARDISSLLGVDIKLKSELVDLEGFEEASDSPSNIVMCSGIDFDMSSYALGYIFSSEKPTFIFSNSYRPSELESLGLFYRSMGFNVSVVEGINDPPYHAFICANG